MQKIIIYICSLLVLGSCAGGRNFDATAFSEVVYQPKHAEGFDIRYCESSGATLISVRNPWQGADGVEQRLLIDPRGVYRGLSQDGIQRIEREARRVICMSSSYVAMLSQMGCEQMLVGVSGADFISNEWVLSNRDKVGDVGYDGNTNYELLLSLEPDIVLLYGISASNNIENKLRELKIPYAYIGEYVESSPLGKAEWMVALGEIVGCRERAEEEFSKIEQKYSEVRSLIGERVGEKRPMVMLNTPYRDAWVIPAQKSYMVRLIEDAGGKTHTIDSQSNSSQPIDLEQALVYAHNSDLWLNVGACGSIEELVAQNPKFSDVEAVSKGKVYNNTKRATAGGGSDFWESGVVRPDIVLMDLCKIFHPELLTEYELYYYKQLK